MRGTLYRPALTDRLHCAGRRALHDVVWRQQDARRDKHSPAALCLRSLPARPLPDASGSVFRRRR